jgi:hypothetical protein
MTFSAGTTLPIRLQRATMVIFLDLSPLVCLAGILQRRWGYRGGQHTEDGVYDRITWSFVRYVLGYRRRVRPRVSRLVDEHAPHVRLVTLPTRSAARQFTEQFHQGAASEP